MTRSVPAAALGLALSLGLSACSDGPSAPQDAPAADVGADVHDTEAADALTDAPVDAAEDADADARADTDDADANSDDTDATDSDVADDTVDADADTGSPDAFHTTPDGCLEYGEPTVAGVLPEALDELSGLVADPVHDDLLWGHNDSGDRARVFAFRPDGTVAAIVSLNDTFAADWEDLASGPCGDAVCLYAGDIGDNARARPTIAVHRFPVPDLTDVPVGDEIWVDAESMTLRWPEANYDSEALLVGDDEQVYLLTKEGRRFGLFSAPFVPNDEAVVLSMLGHVDIRDMEGNAAALVTGADRRPFGDRIAIRSYETAFEVYVADPRGLLTAPRHRIPVADERQGEAIAYATNDGYWHASEDSAAPLHRVRCAP